MLCMLSHFSRVQLCATPWTAAHQTPLSTGFSKQEHQSGLPFLSPKYYMTMSILNFSKMQIQEYNFLCYKAFQIFHYSFIIIIFNLYTYTYLCLFLSVVDLCCCTWAFSSCGKQVLLSSCSIRISHCVGFFCCRAWALGTWASVVVAHRLSCSVAHEIIPDQESSPCPLH